MKFIPDDQFHIVMDRPELGLHQIFPNSNSKAIRKDDLKKIADTGIKLVQEMLQWHKTEPLKGCYDWTMADEMVERPRSCGMKVILLVPNSIPGWMPDDWFVREKDGPPLKGNVPGRWFHTYACLSPWCKEAQDYQDEFIRMVMKRYPAEDVLCVDCCCRAGETVLPSGGYYLYDSNAINNYRDFSGDTKGEPNAMNDATQEWLFESLKKLVIGKQTIFAEHPSRELFIHFHPAFYGWLGTGNQFTEKLVDLILEQIKPSQLYGVLYKYFEVHFPIGEKPIVQTPAIDVNTHAARMRLAAKGMKHFVGSEWPEGMPVTTPIAIQDGLRGLLTSPIHEFLYREKVDQWMVDNFRNSREMFLSSRLKSEQPELS